MLNTLSAWRKHKNKNQSKSNDIMVAVSGSMTAEPIEAYLGKYLLDIGFKNPSIKIAPFNQINQTCHRYEQVFETKPDVIILLWRIEDLFKNVLDNPSELLLAVSDFINNIKTLRKNFSGTIIVSTPPYPDLPIFDVQDLGQVIKNQLFSDVIKEFINSLMHVERTYILDINSLVLKLGMDKAYDTRKWFLYRQPWTENLWSIAAKQASRIIAAQKYASKKCIVLDADNTLWGGIIGEDGIEGIALGDDFPGSAFKAFQEFLVYLEKKGILLAIASKNNEDDFYEVIDNHDAMILKRQHISVFQIHWESKVESIKHIAKELNIATDSMVFIDDNAKEIAEVKERLSDVVCIQVPEDIANLPSLLMGSGFFDTLETTTEDKNRTSMIRINNKRKKSQEKMSEKDFKISLKLEMSFFHMDKQHIARMTQLVNKTNQFNLTTIRRTLDEMTDLSTSKNYHIFGIKLKDKYGDYGLVGVAILKKENDKCIIDSFLMSCRILGRDVETAFLAELMKETKKLKCNVLQGCYIPTKKNLPVKDFYKNHNFIFDKKLNIWSYKLSDTISSPQYIKVV